MHPILDMSSLDRLSTPLPGSAVIQFQQIPHSALGDLSPSNNMLLLLQLDDPLDAIAVHAWNGTWGVVAVGFFAGEGLILASYGPNPYTGNNRPYGCFLGSNGQLIAAQCLYGFWLAGWHIWLDLEARWWP